MSPLILGLGETEAEAFKFKLCLGNLVRPSQNEVKGAGVQLSVSALPDSILRSRDAGGEREGRTEQGRGRGLGEGRGEDRGEREKAVAPVSHSPFPSVSQLCRN